MRLQKCRRPSKERNMSSSMSRTSRTKLKVLYRPSAERPSCWKKKCRPSSKHGFCQTFGRKPIVFQEMVDRMLELSALENQKMLENMECLSFSSIVKTVIESKRPMLSKKNLSLVDQFRNL